MLLDLLLVEMCAYGAGANFMQGVILKPVHICDKLLWCCMYCWISYLVLMCAYEAGSILLQCGFQAGAIWLPCVLLKLVVFCLEVWF